MTIVYLSSVSIYDTKCKSHILNPNMVNSKKCGNSSSILYRQYFIKVYYADAQGLLLWPTDPRSAGSLAIIVMIVLSLH